MTGLAGTVGRFAGKVAFVTGGGSGIGRATALAFAGAGADVVVADVAKARNAETAQAIIGLGARSLSVTCDVTSSNDVKVALAATIDAFGRGELEVLGFRLLRESKAAQCGVAPQLDNLEQALIASARTGVTS